MFVVLCMPLVGCGGSTDEGGSISSQARDGGSPSGAPGGVSDAGTAPSEDTDTFTPEQETDFTFSSPVVVDDAIFIANETLDAVAVVDSTSLAIETVLVGFEPTIIDGPDEERRDEEGRVMVLNEGSDSVTVINPDDLETETHTVMRAANAMSVDPTGRYGVVWHDSSRVEEDETTGDLSSVTIVTPEGPHRVSVGFHVRDVFFDREGRRALVWTDDGVSVIDLPSLEGDTIARPRPLRPDFLEALDPRDLEISVTPDARYVVTRSARLRGLVLLDISKQTRRVVPLPTVPTDLDLATREGSSYILTMLRGTDQVVRAEVPQGLVNTSEALSSRIGPELVRGGSSTRLEETSPTRDAGSGDAASGDISPKRDASSGDATAKDASRDASTGDAETSRDAGGDTEPRDGMSSDVTTPSDGVDGDRDTSDATSQDGGRTGDAESDAGETGTEPFFPSDLEGWEVYNLQVPGLGSAIFGRRGRRAILFSARGAKVEDPETRVISLQVETGTQSTLSLQKGVRGGLSGRQGETFVLYHTKQPGPIPDEASPGDPDYIARSWGVTLLDASSETRQLLLTPQKPGPTTLISPSDEASTLYMAFEPPEREGDAVPAHRDIIEVDLTTFRKQTYRMPSIPKGLGPIRASGRVFIHQRHPEGRMTFIEVATSDRQTITGYQLNANIR